MSTLSTRTAMTVCFVSMVSAVVGLGSAACGSNGTEEANGGASDASTRDANADGSLGIAASEGGEAGSCEPPDMLVALDRTLTMHTTPEGLEPTLATLDQSKFAQAIKAIEATVAAPADQTIRFGLETWPRDPGPDPKGVQRCDTLAEFVGQTNLVSNTACEGATIDVSPALGTGAAIQSLLDPGKSRICFSTPTGAALEDARKELARIRVPGRAQYVVLVTDGADWDQTCPTPDPRIVVDAATASGVGTYVVGFEARADAGVNAGVGRAFLNDMACAGRTAIDFGKNCAASADAGGAYRAIDPNGPTLFLRAGSGQELAAALRGATNAVCTACVSASARGCLGIAVSDVDVSRREARTERRIAHRNGSGSHAMASLACATARV